MVILITPRQVEHLLTIQVALPFPFDINDNQQEACSGWKNYNSRGSFGISR